MATKLELGRLQQIPLREAWQNEAGDFTPWLATSENIGLLGDAIGMSLEVEATEQQVGPFRADIVARNLADDSMVLIENQIEKTDHNHLGQLLTYAAGLEAVTVIWIAERFQDEHRAAVDWLNTITEKRFNFFGLEIELWRIGASPDAPKFNLVCQPNEWVRNKGGVIFPDLTQTRQLQQQYWTEFKRLLDEHRSPLRAGAPAPKPSMSFALGRTGFSLWAVASSYSPLDSSTFESSLRVQVTIEHAESAGLYQSLLLQKADIDNRVGEPLVWMPPDETLRRRRMFLWTPADLEDRTDWARQHQWLKGKLERLHSVFVPLVRDLQPALAEQV